MGNNYYVFSDETGHWNDEVYIQSWAIISEEEYMKLQNKIRLLKQINNIKGELKYSCGYDYSLLMDLKFEVYFTITFCDDFRMRNFRLINHLNSQEDDLFMAKEKNIKGKIMNAVKNSIFLNIYEYYHLENSIKFFKEKFFNSNIIFFIDNPQYQNRDWKEIFSEAGGDSFSLIIVNKSEEFEGIQLADVLVGSMNNILKKIKKNSKFNDFEKLILSKFSQHNGPNKKHLNNPQIIMWDEKHEEFVRQLNESILEASK